MQNISNELIINASRGDVSAFKEIYEISSTYLYTICYRITGNKEDAEEAAQDAFVSIYRNLGKFEFKSSFKTWIYRIATNMAINIYRKRSKERRRTVTFDEGIDPDKHREEKLTPAEEKEGKEIVRSMLESLPEEQKACVVLKDIEGLKYEEIAEVLKININTVRSRLKRAREKLIFLYGKKEKSDEV